MALICPLQKVHQEKVNDWSRSLQQNLKMGLKYLQINHLLPEKLGPQSVACFFRYTAGLNKSPVGDFLWNHDEFCVQVLREFAGTFDFQDMNPDTYSSKILFGDIRFTR
ncbi:ARF guanine-nucleotide exchange factor GNOM [Platanthera zijinensis]|uniref:ARF guanine-nucleotide exchange factor GNOM n=1 Tax=Platanthera zijinensis TaxID=2320716 RepID=A0AAP0B248_9ASPA